MEKIRAVIADDEAPLRFYLKKMLTDAWPELVVCGEAENGEEALALIELLKPDITFLDIRMPGLSGIEVAKKTAGQCLVVFVTAFDQYAVDAFEHEAIDYLLKPFSMERMAQTVERLQKRLHTKYSTSGEYREIMDRFIAGLELQSKRTYLKWIKTQHGDGIRMISIEDVYFFKADAKYTLVVTKKTEALIRKTIKELEEELDPEMFWRIHRGAIVNARFIAATTRSISGRYQLRFKDHPEVLTVSRPYAYLFKQM